MQFSVLALLALAATSVQATTLTETDTSSTLVTITSCASTVTECPASTSAVHNTTAAAVSSAYEGGANKQFAVGGAALVAGALLAL